MQDMLSYLPKKDKKLPDKKLVILLSYFTFPYSLLDYELYKSIGKKRVFHKSNSVLRLIKNSAGLCLSTGVFRLSVSFFFRHSVLSNSVHAPKPLASPASQLFDFKGGTTHNMSCKNTDCQILTESSFPMSFRVVAALVNHKSVPKSVSRATKMYSGNRLESGFVDSDTSVMLLYE